LKFAPSAALGKGSNSVFPVVKPVANLDNDVEFISARTQLTLVVPDGVDPGAVLYKEFLHRPPIF
jgi:hypothetical protein